MASPTSKGGQMPPLPPPLNETLIAMDTVQKTVYPILQKALWESLDV